LKIASGQLTAVFLEWSVHQPTVKRVWWVSTVYPGMSPCISGPIFVATMRPGPFRAPNLKLTRAPVIRILGEYATESGTISYSLFVHVRVRPRDAVICRSSDDLAFLVCSLVRSPITTKIPVVSESKPPHQNARGVLRPQVRGQTLTGVQGQRVQLVGSNSKVRIFSGSPNRKNREAFAADTSAQLGIEVVTFDNADDAVSGTDIVCC
jgi:hypothetical protein